MRRYNIFLTAGFNNIFTIMVIILFDTKARQNLYPLTETKAVADLRYGIFSIKERWEAISGLPVFVQTEDYLSGLYESIPQEEYLYIDAGLKDETALRSRILSLQKGEALHDEHGLIAGRTTDLDFLPEYEQHFENLSMTSSADRLLFPWQIFSWNDEQLRKDFLLLFSRIASQKISETNKIIQSENIIIEEGATVEHCIINASAGPVFIGKNATIMEGCMLRGPIAICEGAVVKMGTKIYGATTIGPYCTVGGEIKNSVLQSYSNKAHDGYLGDAVIGSWCNLGADTNNSNVKNSASDIMVWHEALNATFNVGKKCGAIMGDYSRTAINTSINSGSVIGVCCNVFGNGLTPKFIKDFSWGMDDATPYDIDKAIEHIGNWKKMKGQIFADEEVSALKHIFDQR